LPLPLTKSLTILSRIFFQGQEKMNTDTPIQGADHGEIDHQDRMMVDSPYREQAANNNMDEETGPVQQPSNLGISRDENPAAICNTMIEVSSITFLEAPPASYPAPFFLFVVSRCNRVFRILCSYIF
jgi:hypothetical protein